jgi:hypothetical protein
MGMVVVCTAFRRLRQEDYEASLGYIITPCLQKKIYFSLTSTTMEERNLGKLVSYKKIF